MITQIRSAAIAPGKTGDAIAFAKHVVKYVKEKYGTTAELLMPIGGNPARIAFRIDYENMTAWEALTARLLADHDYQAEMAKNSATFLPGSVHDDFWRTI